MRVVIIDEVDVIGDAPIRAIVEAPAGKTKDDVFLAWYRRNVGDATAEEFTKPAGKFAYYDWREMELTKWSTI